MCVCVCVWVEKILCRVCVQILNEKLEVWSLDRAMFFSAFKNWVIILPSCTQYHTVWKQEKKCFFFFLNKCQLPCEIRLNSNINGLFGQVLSILCVCVRLQWRYISTEDQNHEPCWQPAASAARNKTRNKCFMKQTYTSLPYFLVTSLLPAAESNHHFVVLCFLVVGLHFFPWNFNTF